MSETDIDREAKAITLAEDRGRRKQLVDTKLDGHEQRLNAINGSIDRFSIRLSSLEKRVAESTASQVQSAKNSLDNRTFLIAVAVLAVMIIGLFISAGH
jgi:hypothetical protein